MAALKQRIDEEKANRIIYVTDMGQQPHFDLVFAATRKVNWLKDDQVLTSILLLFLSRY